MPYAEDAATRLRAALAAALPDPTPEVAERKMFGGLAIMVSDHMTVGVIENRVVARIGADAYTDAIGEPDIGPMDFTGRPMKGWVYLMPAIVEDAKRLRAWVAKALAHTRGLGPKKPKKKRAQKTRRTK